MFLKFVRVEVGKVRWVRLGRRRGKVFRVGDLRGYSFLGLGRCRVVVVFE